MRLRKNVAAIAGIGLLGLAIGYTSTPVLAEDRQPPQAAAFAAWKASHPNVDAEIADLNTKTRAAIAAYLPYVPALTPETQLKAKELRLDQPTVVWRVAGGIKEIWDGADLPEMVTVPAGEYTMGTPATEPGHATIEEPRHRVRIAYPLAVSKYPVKVGEFAKFVAETGHPPGNQCQGFLKGKWESIVGCTWKNPPFPQDDNHPAVAVNWDDAKAYVAWLSKKTGHTYRLLSEAEYEYVNRAGASTAYWWGDDPGAACKFANGADLDAKTSPQLGELGVNNCHDGYVFTAPVTAFQPNGFGLYGTTGNTWSWVEDCWNDNYYTAPTDGSANLNGVCLGHVVRGGSWAETPENLRSGKRAWNIFNIWFAMNGFRVARTL